MAFNSSSVASICLPGVFAFARRQVLAAIRDECGDFRRGAAHPEVLIEGRIIFADKIAQHMKALARIVAGAPEAAVGETCGENRLIRAQARQCGFHVLRFGEQHGIEKFANAPREREKAGARRRIACGEGEAREGDLRGVGARQTRTGAMRGGHGRMILSMGSVLALMGLHAGPSSNLPRG